MQTKQEIHKDIFSIVFSFIFNTKYNILLSAFLLPIFFHPIIGLIKLYLHINVVYWSALWSFFTFLLLKFTSKKNHYELIEIKFALLFLIPFIVSLTRGFWHINDIPLEVLKTSQGDNITSASTWYISHALGSLMMIAFAISVSAALRSGLKLWVLIYWSALPIWLISINLIYVVFSSGESIGQLADSGNRNFLLDIGFGAHGNTLGVLFSTAFGLYLGIFKEFDKKYAYKRNFIKITLILIFISTLLTFSRSAYITVLFIYIISNKVKISKIIIYSLLIYMFLIVIGASNPFFDRLLLGLGSASLDDITAHRMSGIWDLIIGDVFINPFFGNGFFYVLWSGSIQESTGFLLPMSHNALLDLVLEMGFIGSFFILTYYWIVLRNIRKLLIYETDKLKLGTLYGISYSLISLILVNIVGERITPEPHHFYFWLCIGIYFYLNQNSNR